MKVLFLEYPPCSTCQKGKEMLDSHNVHMIPPYKRKESDCPEN